MGWSLATRWGATTIAAVLLTAATSAGPAAAGAEGADWQPEVPLPDQADWVQMTSDEWLKGRFIALYNDRLEFDSEEFDRLTLDWEDVRRVRSAQVMQVWLLGGVIARGRIDVDADSLRVEGDAGGTFRRDQIVTITRGAPREIDRWSMDITIGLTARSGNTNKLDANAGAIVYRRTARNRLRLDYTGNFSETEGETTTNDHRAKVNWDLFMTDRFYLTPIQIEYFRDPFQNIAARWTLSTGVGYQVADTRRTEWSISGGPAYQVTLFDDVVQGEDERTTTPALTVGTNLEVNVSRAIDYDFEYRFQITSKEAGTYNHHMVTGFEFDITRRLDFDLSFVWDRIQHPRENADGTFPQQDDYKTIVALKFEF